MFENQQKTSNKPIFHVRLMKVRKRLSKKQQLLKNIVFPEEYKVSATSSLTFHRTRPVVRRLPGKAQ